MRAQVILSLLVLMSTGHLCAQTCQNGSPATVVSVDLSGKQSWDALHDPDNQTFSVCGFPANANMDCNGDCLEDANNNGICDAAEISGCQDATACNYDATATDDSGACTYPATYYNCAGDCLNDADSDGEWTYNSTTLNITHMRANGDVKHWDYTKGTNTGGNSDAVGTLGAREDGAGN